MKKSKLEPHRERIKQMDEQGVRRSEIAKEFGVSAPAITQFLGAKKLNQIQPDPECKPVDEVVA